MTGNPNYIKLRLVGRTIRNVDITRFAAISTGEADAPTLTLDDGTTVRFCVNEDGSGIEVRFGPRRIT